jgi:hypothetical protein
MVLYVGIRESEIPQRIAFSAPRRNQGQAIEVAYGCHSRTCDHDEGCEYRRIVDHSVGPTPRYYRLTTAPVERTDAELAAIDTHLAAVRAAVR